MKGLVYTKGDQKFLKAEEIKRKGKTDFEPVKGDQWMPFDGGKHNGGQWLHEPKE